jgi:hypothetical protein
MRANLKKQMCKTQIHKNNNFKGGGGRNEHKHAKSSYTR